MDQWVNLSKSILFLSKETGVQYLPFGALKVRVLFLNISKGKLRGWFEDQAPDVANCYF